MAPVAGPLLLTVIGSNIISFDMGGEMSALPLIAYRYTGSPFPSEQALAWGAAFVLTVIVLTTNILARWTSASAFKGFGRTMDFAWSFPAQRSTHSNDAGDGDAQEEEVNP